MNPTAQVVFYEKKRLFGILVTSLLAIRYDRDYFIVLGLNGEPRKERVEDIDNIVKSFTVKSTTFKVLKGKRFLERVIFDSKLWTKETLLKAYLETVKD